MYDDGDQVLPLAFHEGFFVVVCMPTNWAGFVLTFVSHEAFKALQTCLVVDMGTAQDGLLSKLEVFETYRARLLLDLLLRDPRKEVVLNFLPLSLT